jgi:hypothetical protein
VGVSFDIDIRALFFFVMELFREFLNGFDEVGRKFTED